MMLKTVLRLLFWLVLPAVGFAQVPKAVPPGRPQIGITQQHLFTPGNFEKVMDLDIYGTKYVTYYYNVSTVKDDLVKTTIQCWFLEEWTEAGKEWLINKYLSMGIDTAGFHHLRYLYYPVTFLYAGPLGEDLYAYQYEYLINEGGELCDENKKIITFVYSTSRFDTIDEKNQDQLLRLAEALKKKYNL